MGLAAASSVGVQSAMSYMLVDLVMNRGAFLAVIALAGLPSLAGFTGKWDLFIAVLNRYSADGGS